QTSEFGTYDFDSHNNQGINTLITWDWFKIRLLYNTTNITTTPGQPDPFTGSMDPVTDDVEFMAAALMIDHGNFMWRSELTQAATDTTDVAWYTSAAYTLGDFTPHITHTRVHAAT